MTSRAQRVTFCFRSDVTVALGPSDARVRVRTSYSESHPVFAPVPPSISIEFCGGKGSTDGRNRKDVDAIDIPGLILHVKGSERVMMIKGEPEEELLRGASASRRELPSPLRGTVSLSLSGRCYGSCDVLISVGTLSLCSARDSPRLEGHRAEPQEAQWPVDHRDYRYRYMYFRPRALGISIVLESWKYVIIQRDRSRAFWSSLHLSCVRL